MGKVGYKSVIGILLSIAIFSCINPKPLKKASSRISKNEHSVAIESTHIINFISVINKFRLTNNINLDYNHIIDYGTDNLEVIPDSIVIKYLHQPIIVNSHLKDSIEYKYYKRLNLSSNFYSIIVYKSVSDTSSFILANYTIKGRLISQIDLCANWGDYGRLAAQIRSNHIETQKYILGVEPPNDISKLNGKFINKTYIIEPLKGNIKILNTDSGKVILKVQNNGFIIPLYGTKLVD